MAEERGPSRKEPQVQRLVGIVAMMERHWNKIGSINSFVFLEVQCGVVEGTAVVE